MGKTSLGIKYSQHSNKHPSQPFQKPPPDPFKYLKTSKESIRPISNFGQIKYFPHWAWEAVQRAFRNSGSGLGGAAVGSA